MIWNVEPPVQYQDSAGALPRLSTPTLLTFVGAAQDQPRAPARAARPEDLQVLPALAAPPSLLTWISDVVTQQAPRAPARQIPADAGVLPALLAPGVWSAGDAPPPPRAQRPPRVDDAQGVPRALLAPPLFSAHEIAPRRYVVARGEDWNGIPALLAPTVYSDADARPRAPARPPLEDARTLPALLAPGLFSGVDTQPRRGTAPRVDEGLALPPMLLPLLQGGWNADAPDRPARRAPARTEDLQPLRALLAPALFSPAAASGPRATPPRADASHVLSPLSVVTLLSGVFDSSPALVRHFRAPADETPPPLRALFLPGGWGPSFDDRPRAPRAPRVDDLPVLQPLVAPLLPIGWMVQEAPIQRRARNVALEQGVGPLPAILRPLVGAFDGAPPASTRRAPLEDQQPLPGLAPVTLAPFFSPDGDLVRAPRWIRALWSELSQPTFPPTSGPAEIIPNLKFKLHGARSSTFLLHGAKSSFVLHGARVAIFLLKDKVP